MFPLELNDLITQFSKSRDTDWFIEEIYSHIESATSFHRCYLQGGLTISYYPLAYRRQLIIDSAFSEYEFDDDELYSLDKVLEAMLEEF